MSDHYDATIPEWAVAAFLIIFAVLVVSVVVSFWRSR